jgi:hypothetical protein
MAIAERDRALSRKSQPTEDVLLDEEEVIPKTFVFVEGQWHGDRF